jgi:hypothetical protein
MSETSDKIKKLETQVKQLQNIVMQVLTKLDNERLNEEVRVYVDPKHDVSEEELYSEAFQIFSVTSDVDEDDDLISNPDNVKPLD